MINVDIVNPLEQCNESADIFTKRAINSPEASSVQICSLRDIKGVIQSLTLQQWQHRWASSQTKLNEIKPSIKPWPSLLTKRRHEVITNRLRIIRDIRGLYIAIS